MTSLVGLVWISSLLRSAAPAALYWCPKTQDGTVQDVAAPGCEPLVDKPESPGQRSRATPDGGSIRDLDHAIRSFKEAYNQLLLSDVTPQQARETIERLDEWASELLAYFQTHVSLNKLLGLTGRDAIVEISQARDRLRALKASLLRRETTALPAIDLAPPLQQPGENSTGPGIGQNFVSGPDIGTTGSPGRSGKDIGATSRSGSDIGSTPTYGTDIGTTPKTGPAIGSSASSRQP